MAPEDGHIHSYNIDEPTCTLDKKCVICGLVVKVALGHSYSGDFSCEPIDEEFHYTKKCERCGMEGGVERHVGLDSYAFHEGSDGKWYHYVGCSKCGWPRTETNYEECQIIWESVSDTEHKKKCKICGHDTILAHDFEYVYINEDYHEYVCKTCGYKKTKFEVHKDEDGDHKCDNCGCEVTLGGEYPILTNVVLKNKEWPDSHFVTKGETIQLIITADRMIKDVKATICSYKGDSIKCTYSADKLTCTAEVVVDEDIGILQNSRVTFSVKCSSASNGKEMISAINETTSDDSYLIYDSISPEIEYIYKNQY